MRLGGAFWLCGLAFFGLHTRIGRGWGVSGEKQRGSGEKVIEKFAFPSRSAARATHWLNSFEERHRHQHHHSCCCGCCWDCHRCCNPIRQIKEQQTDLIMKKLWWLRPKEAEINEWSVRAEFHSGQAPRRWWMGNIANCWLVACAGWPVTTTPSLTDRLVRVIRLKVRRSYHIFRSISHRPAGANDKWEASCLISSPLFTRLKNQCNGKFADWNIYLAKLDV